MIQIEMDAKIDAIINSYPANRRYALAAMQDMQHAFNYIPREGIEKLAVYLECTEAQLYSMATFYKALSLTPKGKHVIKICNGTACHLSGAVDLAAWLERELGIKPGECTADGEFSLEYVYCLGSCALAPSAVVDGVCYNKLTADDLSNIIAKHASEEVR